MKTLVLSLFLASSAAAQPFVGPEVQSAPIASLGDAAVVPAGDGFLIAWSQGDHISVAHLDAALHETDTPFEVPLSDPLAHAPFVTLATNGRSVLLVWKEQRTGFPDTWMATLTADAKAFLASPRLVNTTPYAPAAGVLNGRYALISGDQSLVLTDNLDSVSIAGITPAVSAAISSGGAAGTVALSTNKAYMCVQECHSCFPSCSTLETFTFATPEATKSVAIVFGGISGPKTPPVRDPFIAPDGDHFAGVVVTDQQTDVFELAGGETRRGWTLDPIPAPGIISVAGNGSDVLVVSWSKFALRGIVLHADGSMSAPFVIADYAYNTAVKVLAVNSNEFLVLYRYDVDAQHSTIAGRIIRLQGGRQRAVR